MTEHIGSALQATLERFMNRELPSQEEFERKLAQEERQKRADRAIDKLTKDLAPVHRGALIRNYKIYDKKQTELKSVATDVGNRLSELDVYDGLMDVGIPNLILYGPPGTGKDHVCAALLKYAASRGIISRWMFGPDVFEDYRSGGGGMEAKAKEAGLLCISDPAHESTTEPNRKLLLRVVDRRYRMRRPTWITINIPVRAGESHLQRAGEMLGEQTLSRLRSDGKAVFCNWADFRTRSNRCRA